ncbi:MAG: triosephosphate isomerase [Nitrososphaerota archaeon]|nr:triosephosphate isomerase [Nitrososphaerota archaeon]
MRTIIVNCKNYPETMGDGSLRLAEAVKAAGEDLSVEAIIAPPLPMLALVARTGAKVYSQAVGSEVGDKTTGAVLPEAAKAAGAVGTILNHSESRLPFSELSELVPRVQGMRMGVCLCARTTREASVLASLSPRYVAVEPPGLIGSGIAVSRAKPGLVQKTVSAVRESGFKGGILCGAGIVSGEDVRRAVELGADGVLVASSVVKAQDWRSKVTELAGSLM